MKPQPPCSRNGYFEIPNPNPNPSLPIHGVQLQTKKLCDEEPKKKKNLQRRKKKICDEIEEKRWSEGWVVLMADGYGEESGLEREEEEEKKKKEKRWSKG